MAPAEVITVVPSRSSSFKLANVGPVVGAFSEDRLAGSWARWGARRARSRSTSASRPLPARPPRPTGRASPPATETDREFHVEIAEIPLTTPTLAAISVLEAMDVARHQSGNQDLRGRGQPAPRRLRSAAPRAPLQWARAPRSTPPSTCCRWCRSCSTTRARRSTIDGLSVDVTQSSEPLTVNLIAAHPAERSVRPGDEVPLRLELRRYRGETFQRNVSVTLPDDLPAGPYYLFVGDGGTIDGARLTMEPTEPDDFRESLALLRKLHRPTDLVVLGVLPSAGPGGRRAHAAATARLGALDLVRLGSARRQAGGPRRSRRRCAIARLPARRRRPRRPAGAAAPKVGRRSPASAGQTLAPGSPPNTLGSTSSMRSRAALVASLVLGGLAGSGAATPPRSACSSPSRRRRSAPASSTRSASTRSGSCGWRIAPNDWRRSRSPSCSRPRRFPATTAG